MLNPTNKLSALARMLSIFLILVFFFGAAPLQKAQALPQPYYLTAGPPLADTFLGKYPGLALGDIDGDGDPDALVSDYMGEISYYPNGGGDRSGAHFYELPKNNGGYPAGLQITTALYPPTGPSNPHPLLFDYDKDGDKDLFIATFSNNPLYYTGPPRPRILYFQNDNGSFTRNINNPFLKLFTDQMPDIAAIEDPWVTIAMGDLNKDGLADAVVGYFERTSGLNGYYRLKVVYNDVGGTPVLQNIASLPEIAEGRPSPELVDIDFDGDLDLFVGFENGMIDYFENVTSFGGNLAFAQRFGADNPLDGVDAGLHAVARFADLDSDRRLDVLIAGADGRATYLRNDGSRRTPHFVSLDDFHSPFEGLNTAIKASTFFEGGSAPVFADLDGDGDQDGLVGDFIGAINYLRNDGDAAAPSFTLANSNVFAETSSVFGMPSLVDIDDDADLDLFVRVVPLDIDKNPLDYSLVYYYQNNGPSADPNLPADFVRQDTHALSGFTFPRDASLAFGDLDNDADPDLLIGSKDGDFLYYRNDGTSSAAAFVQDDAGNPLAGVNIPYGTPVLADLDANGELDILVGEGRLFGDLDPNLSAGTFHYFLKVEGVFTEQSGADNPFATLNAHEFAAPALADLDGDLDLDFVSGSGFGTFIFAPNVGTTTAPVFRDYLFNPLAQVQPPDDIGDYSISLNFADVDNDGDQDAFVGTPVIDPLPSRLHFYKNLGTAAEPVYRLQPDDDNPLRNVTSDITLLNVTFANTDTDGDLEAYIGDAGYPLSTLTGTITYYKYIGDVYVAVEDGDQPFPDTFVMDNLFGPRLTFIDRSGNSLLDAYIFLGYVTGQQRAGVCFAENKGTSGLPRFTYSAIIDWLDDPDTNPFYFINHADPITHKNQVEKGMNGVFPDPATAWVGNFDGKAYTMTDTFADPVTHGTYMGRVSAKVDPFNKVKLAGPTFPNALDTNADTLPDAYLAAGDGRIHLFRGSPTPPPSVDPDLLFLALIRK